MKSQRTLSIVAVVIVPLLLISAGLFLVMPRHSERLIDNNTQRQIHHQTGFRIFNRGVRATFTAVIPHWSNPDDFHRQIETKLLEITRNKALEFCRDTDAGAAIRALGQASAVNDYESICHMTLELDTDELVSLRVDYYEYTGGAHGNSVINGWSYRRDHGVEPLALSGLLIDEKSKRLTDLIAADLKRQGASALKDYDPTDAERFSAIMGLPRPFTLCPDGLRFHFSPYAVGSYAEGSYTVTLPWDKIRGLLKPDTALTRWLDSHQDTTGKPAG